jgi:hypothetical protein
MAGRNVRLKMKKSKEILKIGNHSNLLHNRNLKNKENLKKSRKLKICDPSRFGCPWPEWGLDRHFG